MLSALQNASRPSSTVEPPVPGGGSELGAPPEPLAIPETYACYVKRPRSTYDFGVWAWSLRGGGAGGDAGAAAGTAAFEFFDGGFNEASEVLYADLRFLDDVAIVVSRFLAVDFDDQGDAAREEEMNPAVYPHLVRALLKMHPGFERVEMPEGEGSRPFDSAEASPMLRSVHEAFFGSVVPVDEAAFLRPLYAVLGSREGRDSAAERPDTGGAEQPTGGAEHDGDLCTRVRLELWALQETAGEDETLFSRVAR